MLETSARRHVLVEVAGPVATVTMNRPERRNALSVEHMTELTAAFRAIGADREVAVAVLKGNGPVFCSGHDLNEMVGGTPESLRREFELCAVLMQTIQAIPQPVIAQVHGVATAAGCQLVATCDLAVAADDARFATPGVRIGLFCSTPMVALSRAVGRKRALEMLLTGDWVSAEEAVRIGLINRAVPAAELERETGALAEKIVQASRYVVGIGKQAFYRQIDLPQDQAYAYASNVMALNALAHDAQEGMCAFLEKRQPSWENR
ncbi:MAG TPA: enoyl-CoA hydratase [Chloroflexota bacterium]|nr:enoyl-CoA hydratase [Chloroflexota bacterium]